MINALANAAPNHWNNFLWALASPDIAPEYPLPWLPQARRAALNRFFSQADIRSALEPRLLSQLTQLKSHRLGIYFEHLWAFAFTHHPDYELLAHNFPIRDEGKTLGELDFVVRHKPDNTVEHWEIALKFYLHVENYWVGPGLKDRLDIKLDRMRTHQLPIAQDSCATERLRDAGISLDRQWALMPGRRFRPLNADFSTPPKPADFWWADLATFSRHFANTDLESWSLLPKPCWLAPVSGDLGSTPASGESLNEPLLVRGPICIAACDHRGESTRGFVVPADWHTRAAQSLPRAPA